MICIVCDKGIRRHLDNIEGIKVSLQDGQSFYAERHRECEIIDETRQRLAAEGRRRLFLKAAEADPCECIEGDIDKPRITIMCDRCIRVMDLRSGGKGSDDHNQRR